MSWAGGPTVPMRSVRPIAMIGQYQGGPQDFLFGEEYAAIWLEQKRLQSQLHLYSASIPQQILRCCSTPNYVDSTAMMSIGREQSQFAMDDAGVEPRLPSGNQIYWDIELAPSFKLQALGQPNDRPNTTSGAGRNSIPTGQVCLRPCLWTRELHFPERSLRSTILAPAQQHFIPPYRNSAFWRNTSIASSAMVAR